jgi:type II secretory pathway pseudopilin PulG
MLRKDSLSLAIPAMFSKSQISYRKHFGISLIEVLLFIVIVGIAVSGMLAAFRLSVQKSTDPLSRKQVIAIAESMMEEVQLMPFTFHLLRSRRRQCANGNERDGGRWRLRRYRGSVGPRGR